MLSCAGSAYVKTPHIDAIARDGVRFTQARCTTPLCMPSRTTYFSGRSARDNACFANRILLDRDDGHLLTRLRENGYTLALAGKNHAFKDAELEAWDFLELYAMHGKEAERFGSAPRPGEEEVAAWRQREIPFFEAAVHTPQPGSAEDDPTVAQTSHAVHFLQEHDSEHPFFLWLSFEAPHFPYVLPEPYFSRSQVDAMPGLLDASLWKQGPQRLKMQRAGLEMDGMSEDDVRRIQATYCAMIEMVDEQIGRVMTTLEQTGLAENTLVIFASDHGDFWGHRGLVGKSNAVYEDLLRIPTIWRGPQVAKGQVSDAIVENTDFTPTLLELLALNPLPHSEGRSYAEVLRGNSAQHREFSIGESSLGLPAWPTELLDEDIARREALFAEEGVMWFVNRLGGMSQSVFEPPYKLIVNEVDPPELFDIQNDPGETDNLASDPQYQALVERLSTRLPAMAAAIV